MSIGSCLLANELEGMGKEMLEMRIKGDSWADIANKFNLPNPGAARTKFTKLTGITDYKAKGQTLQILANNLSSKASKTGIFAEKQAVKKAQKAVAKKIDPLEGLDDVAKKKLDDLKGYGYTEDSVVYQKTLDNLQKEAAKKAAQEKFPVKTFKEVQEEAVKLDVPVNAKWKSGQQLADDTGLSPEQVGSIIEKNQQGKGYLAIKNEVPGVEFKQIDEVVWNSLLKKYDGDVWKAYSDKVTSQTGFDAVQDLVMKKKTMGMSNADIANLHGMPEEIVEAITKGKWQIPSPGSTKPYVPPAPPKPAAVFGEVPEGFPFRSDEHMKNWIRPDTAELTSGQRSAISSYTSSGYMDINNHLRSGAGSYSERATLDARIRNLDATMRPLPENIRVVRHIHGTELFGTQNVEGLVGKVIRDKGFMSTTVKETGVFTSGNVRLIIDMPKGSQARYVNDISHHSTEQELLVARNTPFKVKAVERATAGSGQRWTVYLEAIA